MQIRRTVVSSWPIKHCDFQKLAGLSLAGEVVNNAGICGSKAAETFSTFQRQFCSAALVTN